VSQSQAEHSQQQQQVVYSGANSVPLATPTPVSSAVANFVYPAVVATPQRQASVEDSGASVHEAINNSQHNKPSAEQLRSVITPPTTMSSDVANFVYPAVVATPQPQRQASVEDGGTSVHEEMAASLPLQHTEVTSSFHVMSNQQQPQQQVIPHAQRQQQKSPIASNKPLLQQKPSLQHQQQHQKVVGNRDNNSPHNKSSAEPLNNQQPKQGGGWFGLGTIKKAIVSRIPDKNAPHMRLPDDNSIPDDQKVVIFP
jgi:hypothetical protein